MRVFQDFWVRWTTFWFDSFSAPRWRLFRTVICSIMFLAYLVRHFSLDVYYSSTTGIFIADPSQFVSMAYRWNLFSSLLSSPFARWAIPALHALYLAALILLVVGRWPRLAAIVAFVLHVSFLHANVGAIYGVDVIFTFYLVFMCMASEGVKRGDQGPRAWVSSMAFRFAQLQLCIIYAFSGWEKLKGAAWWNGEALWSVIANPQMARFDFSWMSHFPLLLVFVTYLTLIWEIYFPVLVWIPRWRIPMLIIGVMFHLSIVGMMKLAFFGFLMISTYVLFLTDSEVQWVWNAFKRVPAVRRLVPKFL